MRTIDKFRQTVRRASIIEKLFSEVSERNKRRAKPNYKLEDEISDTLYYLHSKKEQLVDELLEQGVPQQTLLDIIRLSKV